MSTINQQHDQLGPRSGALERAARPSAPAPATQCPLCASRALTEFFEIPQLPVFVCVLHDSPAEARQAPRGQLALCFCHDCGLVFNRSFEPHKLNFQPGYESALSHSLVFRRYMEGLARRLIDRFGLRQQDVIEVGCGAGYLLDLLAEQGGNRCVGFDPTAEPRELPVGDGRVKTIRDFYSPRYADVPCDFLCSLSVMEDLPAPQQFLRDLLEVVGERPVGCYFEVFNGYGAIERQQTWSIHYEQCNYFSQPTFSELFARSGFQVLNAGPCYEHGEYLFVEAQTAAGSAQPAVSRGSAAALPAEVASFAATHRATIEAWQRRFDDLARGQRTAVVWGSGGKGISFLNAFPDQDVIEYVVDINPNRQGKFIPGSAQKVIAAEELAELRPDTVIITNPIYGQEIKQQVAELGLECDFLVA